MLGVVVISVLCVFRVSKILERTRILRVFLSSEVSKPFNLNMLMMHEYSKLDKLARVCV